VQEESA